MRLRCLRAVLKRPQLLPQQHSSIRFRCTRLEVASLPRAILDRLLDPFVEASPTRQRLSTMVDHSPFSHFPSIIIIIFHLLFQIPAVAVPVRELAVAMSKKAREVMTMLRQMGETNVSLNFMVEPDIAQMVAKEFGLRTKLLKLRDRWGRKDLVAVSL